MKDLFESKPCLICGGKAFAMPLGERSSVDGDWKCESCDFRWKRHGKTFCYVGTDGDYITWLSVPEGLMPVFDDKTHSAAWHREKLV